MQFPQPFTSCRSFSHASTLRQTAAGGNGPEKGKCATFKVQILFRQNTSWQGSVLWMEKSMDESFRSVLELALLMDGALTQARQEQAGE